MNSMEGEKWRTVCVAGLLFIFLSLASSTEQTGSSPSNHKNFTDSSALKMEARDSEGQELESSGGKIETTPSTPASTTPGTLKNHAIYVSPKTRKDPRRGEGSLSFSSLENRGWRSVKSSSRRDSYLEALEHSRTSNDPKEGIIQTDSGISPKSIRREYVQGPVYTPEREYGAPKDRNPVYGAPEVSISAGKTPRVVHGGSSSAQATFSLTPSDSYSLPAHASSNFNDHAGYTGQQNSYGPPQSSYGTPQSNYGPPQGSYGPPSKHYGAPAFQENPYGPPGNSYLPPQQAYGAPGPIYGIPHALPDISHLTIPTIDFSWPFALKLNAFTLAKILLKLVIFKMIVKFIAVICLLLFIPKLEIVKKGNQDEEDEESRALTDPNSTWERLNILTSMVLESVEKYEAQNQGISNEIEKCTTFACRVRRALTSGGTWADYFRLFKNYVIDERQTAEEKKS